MEEVTVTLPSGLDRAGAPQDGQSSEQAPDAATVSAVDWAWVFSADTSPYRAAISRRGKAVELTLTQHGTASVIVAGSGSPPPVDEEQTARLTEIRSRLFPPSTVLADRPAIAPPSLSDVRTARLSISGTHLGEAGSVQVVFDAETIGQLKEVPQIFPVDVTRIDPLAVELQTGDEGTWFAPQRIRLIARLSDEHASQAAEWTPSDPVEVLPGFGRVRYPLRWGPVRQLPEVASRFERRDNQLEGKWPGTFGSQAGWIPHVSQAVTQGKFELRSGGQPFVWNEASEDSRVLRRPDHWSDAPPATCWFAGDSLPLTVTPGDEQPYRLTVYLLDFDRNGRAMEAVIEDTFGTFVDRQQVTTEETERGIYLTWTVTGEVTLTLRKLSGFNVVASGIFIDLPAATQ